MRKSHTGQFSMSARVVLGSSAPRSRVQALGETARTFIEDDLVAEDGDLELARREEAREDVAHRP